MTDEDSLDYEIGVLTLAPKEKIIGALDWEISQLDKDIEESIMKHSMYDDIPTRLQYFNSENNLLKNRATYHSSEFGLPFGLEEEIRTIENHGITGLNGKYIETIQRFKAMQDELDAMKSNYREALIKYRNWIRDYTFSDSEWWLCAKRGWVISDA